MIKSDFADIIDQCQTNESKSGVLDSELIGLFHLGIASIFKDHPDLESIDNPTYSCDFDCKEDEIFKLRPDTVMITMSDGRKELAYERDNLKDTFPIFNKIINLFWQTERVHKKMFFHLESVKFSRINYSGN